MRFLYYMLFVTLPTVAARGQIASSDTLYAPAPCFGCSYGRDLDAAADPTYIDDGRTRVIVSETGRQPDGAVYILVYDEANDYWVQEDSLGHVAPDGGNVAFGRIALSTEGLLTTVSDATSVVVRRRNADTSLWDVEKIINGPGPGDSFFGSDVDIVQLFNDDEVVFIGAQNDGVMPGPTREGTAYPYYRTAASSGWTQEQMLRAPNAAPGEEFGAAVAVAPLSGGHPGDALALVGAPRRPFFTTQEGRALAFRRDGQTRIWTFETELVYPDGNPDVGEFGSSVALLPVPGGEPGELVALVGAPFANVCGVVNTGVAYAFRRLPPNSWTHEATLCSQARRADNRFGSAIAMDVHPVEPLNGGVGVIRALVGTEPGPIPTEGHPGGADLFERTVDELGTVTWTRHAHFQSGATGSANADWYGSAVALAGPFALVGAPVSNVAAPAAGAVFVYGPTVVASEPDIPMAEVSISVYPNPATDFITIETESEEIEIVDVLGRVVLRPLPNERIDVSGLPPGVYIVRAGARNRRITLVH